MTKESSVDHAWRRHSFLVGDKVDLSQAMWRFASERWDGFIFYVDDLGLVHLFLNTNPIDRKGFVVDEDWRPAVRELTVDEVLYRLPAVTMSAYVFDGGDHYRGFQPNPVDNPDAEKISINLEARIHFPSGLTFYSHGNSIGPAMEEGPQDRTLRWAFERWCLSGNENLPVYLTQNPEHFKNHPELIKPEFVKLERPVFASLW